MRSNIWIVFGLLGMNALAGDSISTPVTLRSITEQEYVVELSNQDVIHLPKTWVEKEAPDLTKATPGKKTNVSLPGHIVRAHFKKKGKNEKS